MTWRGIVFALPLDRHKVSWQDKAVADKSALNVVKFNSMKIQARQALVHSMRMPQEGYSPGR
jgi:hypothetical protein